MTSPTNEQQRVDVPSFFADLLCYLSSRDDLAGYEIPQTEQVRDAVAELIEAVIESREATQEFANDGQPDNYRRWDASERRLLAALANVVSQP